MASINVLIILFLCFGTMVMMVGVKCQNLWFDEEPKNVERVGKKLIISGNRHPSINYGKHHHYHRNDVDEMDENNVHPHLHHHHHQHSKNIDQHGRWNTEIYEETIPSPVPLRADDADDDADDDDVTFEEYNDDDDQNLASKADRLSSSLANWKKWSPGTSTYGLMANRGFAVPPMVPTMSTSTTTTTTTSTTGVTKRSSIVGRTDCTNFTNSCHECIRHHQDCSFLICEHRNMCIDVTDADSIKRAHATLHEIILRCHFVDKCSSHPKRNIQQLAAASSVLYASEHGSTNQNKNDENDGQTLAQLRQNTPKLSSMTAVNNHSPQSLSSSSSSSSKMMKNKYRDNVTLLRDIAAMRAMRFEHSKSSSSSSSSNNNNNNNNNGRRQSSSGGDIYYPDASNLFSSRQYLYSSGIESKAVSKFGQRMASEKGNNVYGHIGLSTIIALIISSSMVVSIVVIVACKKIGKIYTHKQSMAYNTLNEEEH